MSDVKVSIIVPIYNVEKYLEQCLESILKQTLKEIEIICINDGSTDGSGKILEKYSKLDQRIHIIKKVNSGYGHSMNLGMDMAKGEYIGIVESDDVAELDMFEILYTQAKQYDLDVSRGHYNKWLSIENTKTAEDLSFVPHEELINLKENQMPFYQAPSIWAAIYRAELIKKNNIKFLETPGASYQDTSFIFKIYALANSFFLSEKIIINYRIDNENSSINSEDKIFYVCGEFAEIEYFARKNNLQKELVYLIPRLKYSCYQWNYSRLAKLHKYKFLKRWGKEFRTHLLRGQIKRKLFSKKEFRRIIKISFFPFIQKFKK